MITGMFRSLAHVVYYLHTIAIDSARAIERTASHGHEKGSLVPLWLSRQEVEHLTGACPLICSSMHLDAGYAKGSSLAQGLVGGKDSNPSHRQQNADRLSILAHDCTEGFN